jgi:hypothetical protein
VVGGRVGTSIVGVGARLATSSVAAGVARPLTVAEVDPSDTPSATGVAGSVGISLAGADAARAGASFEGEGIEEVEPVGAVAATSPTFVPVITGVTVEPARLASGSPAPEGEDDCIEVEVDEDEKNCPGVPLALAELLTDVTSVVAAGTASVITSPLAVMVVIRVIDEVMVSA